MKSKINLLIVLLLMLCLCSCGSKEKIASIYEEADRNDENVVQKTDLDDGVQLSENVLFDFVQEQIGYTDVKEELWNETGSYFGVWEEKIPEFPEEMVTYKAIEENMNGHAVDFKRQFQGDLEKWFSYVDSIEPEKLKSHQDWINENGIMRGYFVVEEIHYQSDQYIAFLVRCGSVENITPPRIYRYQIYSYNLKTGEEMKLEQYHLSNDEWKELIKAQYLLLCEQFPQKYNEKYIDSVLENFDFQKVEAYENDLLYFTDEGIVIYFNSKITEKEIANGFSSIYPGVAWEEMQEFNYIIVPYNVIKKQ